jgi:hypothetical protein
VILDAVITLDKLSDLKTVKDSMLEFFERLVITGEVLLRAVLVSILLNVTVVDVFVPSNVSLFPVVYKYALNAKTERNVKRSKINK